jgi:hypothetical protein
LLRIDCSVDWWLQMGVDKLLSDSIVFDRDGLEARMLFATASHSMVT